MAVMFVPGAGATGILVTRKRPGHFVVLTEDGRIDAMIQGSVKIQDALEKRAPISVKDALQGPSDLSKPLAAAPGIKSVDPYDISVAMPAADGEPVVSDADKDAWVKFRVAYDVTMEATTFKITGVLLLLPSQDPMSLTERGTELFMPVFSPSVTAGFARISDVPRDVVLVNRSHMRRVNAVARR